MLISVNIYYTIKLYKIEEKRKDILKYHFMRFFLHFPRSIHPIKHMAHLILFPDQSF